LKEGEHIRTSVSHMDPDVFLIRRPNGTHLAHPDLGFSLISFVPPRALFTLGRRNAHKRFLGDATKDLSCLRMHCQNGSHEKASSAFVSNLSYATHLVSMRKITSGRILLKFQNRMMLES
jgi:hypothetical protein